ncbi:MAG TPA: NAD(P)-dependent oxidoreductase [Stellaceae bacterium]|jgi:nucleoside-diphosphate-sugar epimerase|nr:NAD(P)-dependent oxidoreductase [Stellaceae bacterium]
MRERVLVTGGAGYIGSVMLPVLLAAGYEVTLLDRFPEGDAALADCCRFDNFSPVKGDARDAALLRRLIAKADIVIPLAALVGAPLCARDPVNAVSINREAVVSLVGMLSRNQRLVFATSNSGYGIGEQGQFCTEQSPLRPVSLYGRTKVEAERAILESGNGVTLRLATVFGMSPRMRLDLLVNDFTYRALTDRALIVFEGHFKRNYIHIRDVAKAFLHTLANYPAMNNQPYNVGLSDANLSKLELCARIKEQVPHFVYIEAPIGEDPDKRDYIVSNAKIEATGWTPDWSIERGIRELVKGYAMLSNARFANS